MRRAIPHLAGPRRSGRLAGRSRSTLQNPRAATLSGTDVAANLTDAVLTGVQGCGLTKRLPGCTPSAT